MMIRSFRIVCVASLWGALFGSDAMCAQELRHEVGLRMRPVELLWHDATSEAKRRALPHLERTVGSFFRLDFSGVSREFDLARLRLEGQSGPARWFDSVSAQPVPRIVEDGERLTLRVVRRYSTPDEWPEIAKLRVTARCRDEDELSFDVTLKDSASAEAIELPWQFSQKSAAGDWRLTLTITDGDRKLREWEDQFSVVPNLKRRLQQLDARVVQCRQSATAQQGCSIQLATAEALLRRIRQVDAGFVPELPFPTAAALERTQRLLLATEEQRFDGLGSSDQWWVIPHQKKLPTLRLWIPPRLSASDPPPLVVAVHGLGGTENLFFEGYGAGRIVELCKARGWILVAPRQPVFGGLGLDALVKSLEPLLPFARDRVFLVGHSKGAGESFAAVARNPKMFRAVALLGGGAFVGDAAVVREVPFWIAAGAHDFAKLGAIRTYRQLVAAGVQCQWHEIPDCEHMTVVSDALPDLFAYFDQWAVRRQRARF